MPGELSFCERIDDISKDDKVLMQGKALNTLFTVEFEFKIYRTVTQVRCDENNSSVVASTFWPYKSTDIFRIKRKLFD